MSKLGVQNYVDHVIVGAGVGCRRDKMWLQLIYCALVLKPGCLVILEGWRSRVRSRVSGKDLEVLGGECYAE